MTRSTAILILLLAATLEAGGDAIIRVGLHSILQISDVVWVYPNNLWVASERTTQEQRR
jgi:hypothetical protein